MNRKTWNRFAALRDRFRRLTEELDRELPDLRIWQQELAERRGGPAYQVETPVVANGALDEIGPDARIKLILVADNPGRREQEAENRRYLAGPSGKLAEKFFREHPALGIDFRRELIILNKTPIHTSRTAELRELCRIGGAALVRALRESQEAMARLLLEFHQALAPLPVWIVGYSEMKSGGVFEVYTKALEDRYRGLEERREELFMYRHFSMNQFTIDLRRQALEGEPEACALARIGRAYRRRIVGW